MSAPSRPAATKSARWRTRSTGMADDLGARAAALAASDRARRQLLADVSHELMTPLAAVRGYTETLAMPELALDAATREPLSRHHRRRDARSWSR